MKSHLYKTYQQAAHIQVQRFIFVRLLAEYAKRLKEAGDTFQASGIGAIDLYTDATNNKTYAYITAGAKGWYILDVTDPTSPYIKKRYENMTNREFRGIAVEQGSGILGITENITFAGEGGQYGYIRFYDLNADPTNPTQIGQERLAEAYSGIPGRVSISGNYAYVATVMVGLQVIDIEQSKKHTLANSGEAIVGIYDTIGEGYRSPADIAIYNGATALLTTVTGNLLVIDVHAPPMTELIKALDKNTAFRVAATSGVLFQDLWDS